MTYNEMFASSTCSRMCRPPFPSSECGVMCVDGALRANIACKDPPDSCSSRGHLPLIPLLVKYPNDCRSQPRGFGISLKGGSCPGNRPPPFFKSCKLNLDSLLCVEDHLEASPPLAPTLRSLTNLSLFCGRRKHMKPLFIVRSLLDRSRMRSTSDGLIPPRRTWAQNPPGINNPLRFVPCRVTCTLQLHPTPPFPFVTKTWGPLGVDNSMF